MLVALLALVVASSTPPIDELYLAIPETIVNIDVDTRRRALTAPRALIDRRNGFVHVELVTHERTTIEAAVFLGSGRRLLAVTSRTGCQRQWLRVLDIDKGWADVTGDAVPVVRLDEFYEGNGEEPALVEFMLPRHGTSIGVAMTSFCVGAPVLDLQPSMSTGGIMSALNAKTTVVRLAFDGVGAFTRAQAKGGRHSRSDRVPCIAEAKRAAFVDLVDGRSMLGCIEADGGVEIYVVDDARYRLAAFESPHGAHPVKTVVHDGHLDTVVELGDGITITEHVTVDDAGVVALIEQCTISLQAVSDAARHRLGTGAMTTAAKKEPLRPLSKAAVQRDRELLDRVHLALLGDDDARAFWAGSHDYLHPQNGWQRAMNHHLRLYERVDARRTCGPVP